MQGTPKKPIHRRWLVGCRLLLTVVLLSQHRDKGICLDEPGSWQMYTQASALALLFAQTPDDVIGVEIELDELDLTSADK